MSNAVSVAAEEGMPEPEWTDRVEPFILKAMDFLSLDGEELSVLLCGDGLIRELNGTYRGVDAPTDVLSFAAEDGAPSECGADTADAARAGNGALCGDGAAREKDGALSGGGKQGAAAAGKSARIAETAAAAGTPSPRGDGGGCGKNRADRDGGGGEIRADRGFAFPARESGLRYVGDIAVSVETLRKNAAEFHVDEDSELKRLLVHGILHLNGMDHGDEHIAEGAVPKCEMLVVQEKTLEALADEKIMELPNTQEIPERSGNAL